MPLDFVDLTFANVATAIGLVVVIAGLTGIAYYTFRQQKPKVKLDAVKEWSEVAAALSEKVDLLTKEINGLRADHERCQLKINRITAFNLRLQAREAKYQRTINRLERKLGEDITDFSEMDDAPEDSPFG